MTVLNLTGKPQAAAVSGVYMQYLACDLREAGAGCLPQGIAALHLQTVPGSLELQLDAWLNIGEVSFALVVLAIVTNMSACFLAVARCKCVIGAFCY
jgi:RecQ mediated genome instability protein